MGTVANITMPPKTIRFKHIVPNSKVSRQFKLFELEQSPDLIIAPVPKNLALAPDHFYVYCGDWFAGIQLTREQAYRASELCGRRRAPDAIWNAIEAVIDGGMQ